MRDELWIWSRPHVFRPGSFDDDDDGGDGERLLNKVHLIFHSYPISE